MATSAVTKDCILLIDPGVNLASRRFGLPPHAMEEERRYSVGNLRRAIGYFKEMVSKTEIQKLVLDHHLLPELKWKSRLKEVFLAAKTRGWR